MMEMDTIDDAELANILDEMEKSGAVPPPRDAFVQDTDVEAYITSMKKGNTVKATSRDVANVKRWLAVNKWELRELDDIPVKDLDGYLSQMWISIRKKDGGEYEPSTLEQIKCSLDRHLREKSSGQLTLRSNDFHLSNRALTARKMELKQHGLGRRAHKALQITDTDEDKLWEKKEMGTDTPTALQFTLFFMLTKGMGFRGREQHRKLRFGDIVLGRNADGLRYLEFHERDSKTMDGSGNSDWRATVPRIYSDGTERDPINVYEEFVRRRPTTSRAKDSPFYLTPVPTKRILADEINSAWFYATPMGQNTLGQLMKRACDAAGIDGKKTNHSLRKSTVKTLQKAGVAPHKICQITGHKNPSSLKSYDDELEEEEQIAYSNLLSTRKPLSSMQSQATVTQPQSIPNANGNVPVSGKGPLVEVAQSAIRTSTSTVTSSQQQVTATGQTKLGHGGQEIFNFSGMQNCSFAFKIVNVMGEPKPKVRRVNVIESDSSQSQ